MEALVVDTGYFLDVALALGRSNFETVYYYIDWVEGLPSLEKYVIGDGFPEIIKVQDFGSFLDKVDVIVFADVGFGSMADYLRSKGKAVFGASYLGQQLELDREFLHKIATEKGIGRPRTIVANGIDEAKKAVDELGGAYVKVSMFRGNMETAYVNDSKELEVLVSDAGFGIYADSLEFLVEEPLASKGVEIGCDVMFNGKEFVRPYLFGLEIKDLANYSRWVEESVFDDLLLSRIESFLAESGYRGTISFEAILNEEGLFLLDVTARYPFPAEGIITRAIRNYDEVVLDVANGNYPDIDLVAEFGAEIVVWAEKGNWIPLTVEGEEEMYSWRFTVRKSGKYWRVPSGEPIAGAVGLGNTLEEAKDIANERAEKIKGRKVNNGVLAWSVFEKRRKELARLLGGDVFA